ncbi:PLD nuclease N-terminal domain-containing protein [Lacticigenium naphthae]|uniref:PLD nuclease N-terminal domain-containing protein n=1 Tax=Lacticigenium naphthae TaxID=515351 RepID=UPI0003FD4BB9|nr:PLD nuclease N-terminal domain-containing protein [Lacticigenium naphthae]
MPDMTIIQENLPLLIPLFLIQLVLMITALIHLLNHPNVKRGSKIMWIFIIVFVNTFGPIAYFLFGRSEE